MSANIEDEAGNLIGEEYSWTFTTGEGPPQVTAPSLSDIASLLTTINSSGMVPGKSWSSVILPPCAYSNGSSLDVEVIYSVSGLPSWLSFDPSTRILSLVGGSVSNDAYSVVELTYSCTIISAAVSSADIDYDLATFFAANGGSDTFSVNFNPNDADGDGMSDGKEFLYSEVPLVDNKTGWVWLTSDNVDLYRPYASGNFKIATGIVVATEGLDMMDASDKLGDLDDDGVSNYDEVIAGTNPFVAASTGTFATHFNLTSDEIQNGIAMGDMNNDGFLDVIASELNGQDVAIFLGDGAGAFGSAQEYDITGGGGYDVSVGDLDGDGYLDLVGLTSSLNQVYRRLNNQNGTFSSESTYSTGSDWPLHVVIANLSGNGNLDLAVTVGGIAGSSKVYTFMGTGTGSFVYDDDQVVGSPDGISVADLDGDNDLDLAIASCSDNGLKILLNTGNGAFSSPVAYTAATCPYGVTAGDLDSDGDIDLVTSNYFAGNISVFMNNGNGTFATKIDYDITGGPYQGVAADLDGDGDLDLAITDWDSYNVSILKNNGNGTFAAEVIYPAVDSDSYATDIVAADFNGDGALDLAVSDYYDAVGILLNQ